MTYACSCGWSVHLEDGLEHRDVFLKHFQSNPNIHKVKTVESQDLDNLAD